jgi:hypothetical protein
VVAVALSATSTSTNGGDPVSPPTASRADAPIPPARSTRGELKLGSVPATRSHARLTRRSNPHAPRPRHQPARTHRDRRHARTEAPHHTVSARRVPPAAPPTPRPARRDPPPITPASSACDEFPPC